LGAFQVKTVVAILYIVAVVLLCLAAFGVPARVSLALLGAAAALLAYSLPSMAAGFSG
jgi:hypothetical protein